jgi:hypothetical protein
MRFNRHLAIILLSLFSLTNVNASSVDEFDGGGFDDDAGFDDGAGFDDTLMIDSSELELTEDKPTQINGTISFETHYNTKNDLKISMFKLSTNLDITHSLQNKAKIRANLKANNDFIFDSGLSNYNSTPNGYGSETSLDQISYEQSITPELDIKFGRQIVSWGVSDLIRVNDAINPTDNRVPGLTDIKDLKLGVVMTKLDYFPSSDSSISYQGILINEHRFSLYPRYGSDFKSTSDLDEVKPNNSLKNTGIGLALNKTLLSADASLYYLHTYVDKPVLDAGKISLNNNKANKVGIAYNVVNGSFLIKAEASYTDSVNYNLDASTIVDKPVSKILLGFDYNGFTDTNLTYEIAQETIGKYDVLLNNQYNMNLEEKTHTQAFRVSKRLLNDELEVNGMVMAFGTSLNSGGVVKISTTYDYTDNIDINAGHINYLSSDNNSFIDGIKDNDRLFLKVNYKF